MKDNQENEVDNEKTTMNRIINLAYVKDKKEGLTAMLNMNAFIDYETLHSKTLLQYHTVDLFETVPCLNVMVKRPLGLFRSRDGEQYCLMSIIENNDFVSLLENKVSHIENAIKTILACAYHDGQTDWELLEFHYFGGQFFHYFGERIEETIPSGCVFLIGKVPLFEFKRCTSDDHSRYFNKGCQVMLMYGGEQFQVKVFFLKSMSEFDGVRNRVLGMMPLAFDNLKEMER